MRIALLFAAVALVACSSSDTVEGTHTCAASLDGTWSVADSFKSSAGDCSSIQPVVDQAFFLGSSTADTSKATWIDKGAQGEDDTFAIASASSCAFVATRALTSTAGNGQMLVEARTYNLDDSPDHKTIRGTLTFKVFAAGDNPTTATPMCTANFISSAVRE